MCAKRASQGAMYRSQLPAVDGKQHPEYREAAANPATAAWAYLPCQFVCYVRSAIDLVTAAAGACSQLGAYINAMQLGT